MVQMEATLGQWMAVMWVVQAAREQAELVLHVRPQGQAGLQLPKKQWLQR